MDAKHPSSPSPSHDDNGVEIVELPAPDDTLPLLKSPLPTVTSPLPRLDDSSRYRPRGEGAPGQAQEQDHARPPSPPTHRTGPMTIRETTEIPLPIPARAPELAAPPPPSSATAQTTPGGGLSSQHPTLRRPRRTPSHMSTASQNQARSRPQSRPQTRCSTPAPPSRSHPHPHPPTPSPSAHSSPRPNLFFTPHSPPQDHASASPRPSSSHSINPKIAIPKIPPLSFGFSPPPNLQQLAQGLEGMYVDEFGNVLDWEGHVLGRVEGDLPAMVGRPVSGSGEVRGEDGIVVGFVVENEMVEKREVRDLQSLAGGLRVDYGGNILDAEGHIVGHLNVPPGGQGPPQAQTPAAQDQSGQGPRQQQQQQQTYVQPPSSISTTPSPSEIFLDVKSTNDGIQLIIKIPTVFNRGMPNPTPTTVHIS